VLREDKITGLGILRVVCLESIDDLQSRSIGANRLGELHLESLSDTLVVRDNVCREVGLNLQGLAYHFEVVARSGSLGGTSRLDTLVACVSFLDSLLEISLREGVAQESLVPNDTTAEKSGGHDGPAILTVE
jgi:hypothetical protein